MNNLEFWLTVIGSGMVFGVSGWAIGRDGFRAHVEWVACVFEGSPPEPYESWQHFAGSRVKSGVTIRASTPEDWNY